MKFAIKPIWHYPPHLRHVVTLPWEIKTSNFLQILKKKRTDRAVPALKKTLSFFRSSRSLPLTLFCQFSGEVTENTFLSVKKTKLVAYCANFWSRSLAGFMRAAQFASASSCAWHLLKYFRYKSLQIIWDTDDRWIPISRDTSRTVLWVCGLSSWVRTKSLTVSMFSSVRAQIDGKSK